MSRPQGWSSLRNSRLHHVGADRRLAGNAPFPPLAEMPTAQPCQEVAEKVSWLSVTTGIVTVIRKGLEIAVARCLARYLSTCQGIRPPRLSRPVSFPDFNPDGPIQKQTIESTAANLWLGNRAAVQERVSKFAADQAGMNDEVKRRFHMALQSRDETLPHSA